jgi:aspartate racemase
MRTIGLLGGMGWPSSAEYYRLLNETVRRRLGGIHSARCVLFSVDHAEIKALRYEESWDQLGTLMSEAARRTQDAGAELLLLCSNTMHQIAETIAGAVEIPLLHIVDTTSDRVRAQRLRTVGLIGTRPTMERPFFRERMQSRGDIGVLVPEGRERVEIDEVIFGELAHGRISDTSRKYLLDSIARLVDAGAEGIVLGCTEIELFVRPSDSSVPVFPTARIHVEAAVDVALAADDSEQS